MDIHYLIPLVAAVIYTSLLIIIVLNRPWQKQHKLFVAYLVAATLWSLSDFLMRSPSYPEHKLLLFRLVCFFSIWWAVQLYYFARIFLKLSGGWVVWFGSISLAIFGIIALLGYAPPAIAFNNGVVNPENGWWFNVYLSSMAIPALMGLYSLRKGLKIAADPRERNKIAYLIIAVCLLSIFGFFGITPVAGGYPITHVGAVLSAGILTYAVMKHELLSINAILRRGLGWASLFVVGTGTYMLIFYFFNLFLGFHLRFVSLLSATLLSSAVSILVYRLRPIFLGMVDQLFYRGTYSSRQALLDFNSNMGNIINLEELASEMLPKVAQALRTQQAKLLFEDNNSGDFTTQFTFPESQTESSHELRFAHDNPIITWLRKQPTPLNTRQIDFIPQLKGLWQTERERLTTSNVALLCAIKSRGQLIGILALGRKSGNARYSQEDIELVTSLASQAGIIIENATMLDSLKKQQLQVEQLLAELVHAQEEERQRISADLHDGVAQWLAGASYRAQTVDALLSGNGNHEARNELATMEDTIDKSLRELRRVLTGLRPPALDELGLTHAIRQCLDTLKADGVDCKFTEEGLPLRLPPSIEIAIYRVVQECITNIRKHANASKTDLRLQFEGDNLLIEVQDNGQGFNLSQKLSSAISVGHMGLLGMKQRAEMLGGKMRIRTGEGRGTTITLNLPINPQEDDNNG